MFAGSVAVALTGCTTTTRTPKFPSFQGHQTDSWLAYEVELGREPSDLLPAFEASARAYGCSTEQLGGGAEQNIGGELRHWYGISASCDDENIALVTLVGARVRVGCTKPTTRERCDLLLRKISEAR
jgi:hypothetical protein